MLTDRSTTTLRASSMISQTMSPTLQTNPPSPSASSAHSRSRMRQSKPQNPSSFHLGSLPRFHPAVYQSPATASSGPAPQLQTSSPSATTSPNLQQFAHTYRIPPNTRDTLRQYRDLVAGITLTPRGSVSSASTKPSKPKLAPLGSPGPVTPLALEEEENEGYLIAGAMGVAADGREAQSMPPQELLEQLIQRERERIASSPHGSRTETRKR